MKSSNKFLTSALFACALVVGCGSDDNNAQPLTEAPVAPTAAPGVDPDIALKAAFTAKIEGIWETDCITVASKDPKFSVFSGRVVVYNPVILDSWTFYKDRTDCIKGKSEMDDGMAAGLVSGRGGFYAMMDVGGASESFLNTRKLDMRSQTAGNTFQILQINESTDPKVTSNLLFGNVNKKSVRSGVVHNGKDSKNRPDDLDKTFVYSFRAGSPELYMHPSIKLRVQNEAALSDANKAEIAVLQKKMDGLVADARKQMKDLELAKSTALADLEKALRKEMADKLAKAAELKKASDETSKKELAKITGEQTAIAAELKRVRAELVAVNHKLDVKQSDAEKAATAQARAENATRDSNKTLSELREHVAVLQADHDTMAKAVLSQAGIIQAKSAEIQRKEAQIQSKDAEIERLEKIILEN